METPVLLKISGLSKSFGPVRALRDVGFELRAGEIHAIAGENGAGKSTLMKVIDGILAPDSGDIQVDGRSVSIPSPLAAQKLGIGFVHQEIALCPDISVAENIFMSLTNASKALLMNYRDLEKRATAILARLGNIDPAATVRNLSISQQQLVEIAKALTLDCRILIFDEPTAALTEREAQKLFEIIHQLAGEGIGIIYISHRMAEIFDNCDRVTVLRDGRYITTLEIAETTPEQVVASMVGRVIDSLYPEKLRDDERSEDILLEIAGLCEATAFRDISFQLRKGEILGIGGLIGAGRSEIVKGICRLEGEVTGDVILRGKRLSLTHYGDSIAAGIVYLSEDRKGDGLFLDMSIAANISALAVDRIATRSGLINERREKQRAEAIGKQLSLKCGHVGQPVSTLSGGNQQKVAIAKMLSVDPKVIFLDEPTRGVDVGAKAEIHRILRRLARDGVGIVVISSELPELIGICDRVLIVREGRITGEVAGAEMTEENIMVLASLADEGRQRSAA
ncbi:sugar ABC transporter ATP-binding protein [Mesorhizobium sp. M4B.F.Ca.ET.215.01.1.1]|uniref:sugar ABC transporter ATP-binding protein n=1 Tax=unclassified Mesorhizobium TaxID=325217 RepID=UPI000FCA142F|nr:MULTISPECIES: sugar ABC transporter ATP-binding protein [unclassified Mesorhizobium]RUW28304.1 sugar ABC transporter ATP-binding protein [Mesorhizobium sp. M4B.F.Ca.ET.013.02.1.1]RVD38884.1 sugar ABC transporter ATP-binding protein [Mesorhizobium sp. M4B.F.Ca.ET.019.03.1.1]TGQ10699.1 sugar ABC transporter ATP-binding protein [Mesorhizobium sp. M4B.F.Ca.ET.215.01.1.1]TGQ36269.1 sugar ABC transporter ATP-binding protein [Mesorhizobium sp. M4B.F.Ca.ET.214.01.1.1]TGQ38203.1 sugar ABC transporte